MSDAKGNDPATAPTPGQNVANDDDGARRGDGGSGSVRDRQAAAHTEPVEPPRKTGMLEVRATL